MRIGKLKRQTNILDNDIDGVIAGVAALRAQKVADENQKLIAVGCGKDS